MHASSLFAKETVSPGGNRLNFGAKCERSTPMILLRIRSLKIMKHCWLWIVGGILPVLLLAQTVGTREKQNERGPYARIALMRALDGHSIDWEAGYIRHLACHRQAKDPFNWYSYSVWASTERQGWII